MNVEYVPVRDLIPYARNPRKNEGSVSAVAASIRQFGFRNPIIVDANGTVIAGHTRLKAAKALKMDVVPVVRVDDLTEEEANAFRLADNKAQELSSWDFSLLMDELTEINGIDMTEFGFADVSGEGDKEPERKKTTESRKSNLDDGYEIDVDSFAEEEFACECPECGFRFNE